MREGLKEMFVMGRLQYLVNQRKYEEAKKHLIVYVDYLTQPLRCYKEIITTRKCGEGEPIENYGSDYEETIKKCISLIEIVISKNAGILSKIYKPIN